MREEEGKDVEATRLLLKASGVWVGAPRPRFAPAAQRLPCSCSRCITRAALTLAPRAPRHNPAARVTRRLTHPPPAPPPAPLFRFLRAGRRSAFDVREAEGKDVEATRLLLKASGVWVGAPRPRLAPAAQRLPCSCSRCSTRAALTLAPRAPRHNSVAA